MTEFISSIAGILISLAFSYIPGLSDWFEKLEGDQKRLVVGLSLVLAAGLIFGAACLGWISSITCTVASLPVLGNALVSALIANQATYVYMLKKKAKQAGQ